MIYLPKNIEVEINPYRHFFSDYIVSNELYLKIKEWLSTEAPWELVEEDFYTQYEFSLKHTELPSFMSFLTNENYLDYLKQFIENLYETSLLGSVDVVGHLLTKGHVIKIHNDYISPSDSKINESHRLLFHFNGDWDIENGGLCMVFSSDDATSVSNIVVPNGYLLNSFEISKDSHHAVSQIIHGNRITIIYTFYKEVVNYG